MTVNGIQPSFGMALKYKIPKEDIQMHIAYKMDMDDTIAADKLLKKLEKHYADAMVRLVTKKDGTEQLQTMIGDKTFTENFFNSPLRVLKRTYKAAEKLPDNSRVIKSSEHPYLELEI